MNHPTRSLAMALAIVAVVFSAASTFHGWELLLALVLAAFVFVLLNESGPPDAAPPYRLEHRRPGDVRILATAGDRGTGQARLQARATQLMAEGATGQLVLIEVATGRAVIWQVLGSRASDRAAT
jgi:hypothetical protein